MNKYLFAFVALVAVVNGQPGYPAPGRYAPRPLAQVAYNAVPVAVAPPAPRYIPAPAPLYAKPAPLYAAPASIYPAPAPIYPAPAPIYPAPAPIYGAPTLAIQLQPANINPAKIINAPGPIGALIAAPSNPSASASAVAANAGLNAGRYTQIAVPSYSVISGVPGPVLPARYAPAPY